MSIREALLAVFLIVACGLIVWGVSMWSIPTAVVLAGVLTAMVAVIFLAEVAS